MELLPNPSHLEAVNPLVWDGEVQMDQIGDSVGEKVMPIVIHGDAAFAGQGVVYETMQMAKLEAYQREARSTSSATTRSGSPQTPTKAARRATPPTLARPSGVRSSTSTPTTLRRWCACFSSPPSTASSTTAT